MSPQRRPLIALCGVLGALIVIAAVVLLVMRPWKSNGTSTAGSGEFRLDHGVVVRIDVPDGWEAHASSTGHPEPIVFLVPTNSAVTSYGAADSHWGRLEEGETTEPVHFVTIEASEGCPLGSGTGDIPDGWHLDEREYRTEGTSQVQTVYADADLCLTDDLSVTIKGGDAGGDPVDPIAADMVDRLVADGAVTATLD